MRGGMLVVVAVVSGLAPLTAEAFPWGALGRAAKSAGKGGSRAGRAAGGAAVGGAMLDDAARAGRFGGAARGGDELGHLGSYGDDLSRTGTIEGVPLSSIDDASLALLGEVDAAGAPTLRSFVREHGLDVLEGAGGALSDALEGAEAAPPAATSGLHPRCAEWTTVVVEGQSYPACAHPSERGWAGPIVLRTGTPDTSRVLEWVDQSGRAQGRFVERSTDGSILTGSMKNGVWHGLFVRRAASGQVLHSATHREGAPDGVETHFFNSGTRRAEIHWKNGELEGPWTWFHENGERAVEVRFRRGVIHGAWTSWDAGGKIVARGKYARGRPARR